MYPYLNDVGEEANTRTKPTNVTRLEHTSSSSNSHTFRDKSTLCIYVDTYPKL